MSANIGDRPVHLSVGTFSHSSNSNNRVTNLTYNAKMHFGFTLSGTLFERIGALFLVTMATIVTHEIFPSLVSHDLSACAVWLAPIIGTAFVAAVLARGFFETKADECIDQIKYNPPLAKQLHASVFEDRIFVTKLLNTNHEAYPYLPQKLQNDVEFLMIRRVGQFLALPNKINERSNEHRTENYIKAIEPRIKDYLKTLPKDASTEKRELEVRRAHIELAFPEKLFDPGLDAEAIKICETLKTAADKENYLVEVVRNNPFIYSKLSLELRKNDKSAIAKTAVEGHHSMWLFVPEELSAGIKQYYDKSVRDAYNP